MNSWGQAFQTNSGAGVLGVTPYGAGHLPGHGAHRGPELRALLPPLPLRAGQVDPEHGDEVRRPLHLRGRSTRRPTRHVAYAQSDQCWLLDGLWMAGGTAPSVGLQGAGEPNPGQGSNRLVQPDLMERWQDSVFSFHIKDLGPNDQGTQVVNVGDNTRRPARATRPVRRGAVGDGRQPGHRAVPEDLRALPPSGVPRVPVRARRHERHRHEQRVLEEAVRPGVRHVRQARARSRPGRRSGRRSTSRRPTREWAATTWLPTSSAVRRGSTARRSATALRGRSARRAQRREPGRHGQGRHQAVTWRPRQTGAGDGRRFSYLWLRDGAPLPLYNGAPIGSKPECECDATERNRVRGPAAGRRPLAELQVTASTNRRTRRRTCQLTAGQSLGRNQTDCAGRATTCVATRDARSRRWACRATWITS